MAEENQQPTEGEGNAPQDPAGEPQPQDPRAREGATPQDPADGEGKETTPNVHKLERDVANRDKQIAELKQKLAAAEKGGSDLEARIAALEKQATESATEAANAKADAALTAAGCVDCELGRTALAAYEGDVDKRKQAKPYLFAATGGNKGTGGRAAGTPGGTAKTIGEALAQMKNK